MNESYTVYMHTCPNGKRYVGVTGKNPKDRWDNGNGYQKQLFGSAVNKYGWNSIYHEILATGLTKEIAEKREQFFIALFRTQNQKFGYNLTSGGNLGSKVSDEVRKKQSEEVRLRWKNEEYRAKICASLLETHRTEAFRQRLREVNAGKKMSPDAKAKISAAFRGRISPMKGKHHSAASKLQTSMALKGKTFSDDTKEKLRAAATADRGKAVINCDTGEVFESIAFAAKHNGLVRENLRACVHGKRKSCGGYRWAYYKEGD